jgi:hypothetical protein
MARMMLRAILTQGELLDMLLDDVTKWRKSRWA